MSENYSIRDIPANLESVGVEDHTEVKVSRCNSRLAVLFFTPVILCADIGWEFAAITSYFAPLLEILLALSSAPYLYAVLLFWKTMYNQELPPRFLISLQMVHTMSVLIIPVVRTIFMSNDIIGVAKPFLSLLYISTMVLFISVITIEFLDILKIGISKAGCMSAYLQWLSNTLHSPRRLLRSLRNCLLWFRTLRVENIDTIEDGHVD